jgi:hypothetical protein
LLLLVRGDRSKELKILIGRRTDLVADRTRTINRLRDALTGIFPALEQGLEVTNRGPLVLLSTYQTPAAERQHTSLPGEKLTASIVARLACSADSRRFYDRKRAEGKHHTQAVIALARRRVNVLWALLRDNRCYQPTPPITAAAA